MFLKSPFKVMMKRPMGVTLVELLVAIFILSAGIGGALLLFVNSMISSEHAWDLTVATMHAEHVLEEMQRRDSIDNIITTDWAGWAEQQGLNTLEKEAMAVEFTDKSSNPLGIEVTVQWMRKQRTHNIALKTQLAK